MGVILTQIHFKGKYFQDNLSYQFLPDQKDAPFIYLYEKENPDFVVSDDKHFKMSIIPLSKLVSASQFVDWVVDNN